MNSTMSMGMGHHGSLIPLCKSDPLCALDLTYFSKSLAKQVEIFGVAQYFSLFQD